jgi:hypothetical protein
MHKAKPNNWESCFPIMYFQSREFGWMTADCLRPFEPFKAKFMAKNKTKHFRTACDEACDPTKWDVPTFAWPFEEEEEDSADEPEPVVKKGTRKRRMADSGDKKKQVRIFVIQDSS